MTGGDLEALRQAVQTNCDIADARHAGELTLCSYLLQMREYHRWQMGAGFEQVLARDAVGGWIAEREALWDRLEGADYVDLPLPGAAAVEPFDVATANAALAPHGLVYGAGQVLRGPAVFFLAEVHPRPPASPLPVQVAAREMARGLAAPPAVLDTRGEPPTIVLRRDALARWCWQLLDAYRLHARDGSAFDALLQLHPLHLDFEAALPRWLDEQSEALVLHELGEHRAGHMLGAGWTALREALPTRRGALFARALRDQLADLGVTLPQLLDRGAEASVHFWFAQYDGPRRAMFPTFDQAYAAWRAGDGGHALRGAAATGHAHLLALAQRAMAAADAAAAETLLCSAASVCPGPPWS